MPRSERPPLRPMLVCGALFAFIYAAFGVHSPFLPPLLQDRGMDEALIGVLLAAATALKLVVAPLAGRAGDRYHAIPFTLAVATLGSAAVSLLYVTSAMPLALIAVVLAHALFTGPIAPLSDAIGLTASQNNATRYGWIRGVGSTMFVIGIFISGQIVNRYGLGAAFIVNTALLLPAAVLALLSSGGRLRDHDRSEIKGAFRALVSLKPFRLAIAISGLILGSHALHDGFTMIRWREAGIEPAIAAALWAIAVAAEVVVFFVIGGPILARLGARGACLVACAAAVVRWSVMGVTATPLVMAFVQPLHGLTFALLHLACMQLIARNVPQEFFGAAQGLYATLGAGVSSVLLTIVAGVLFSAWGASAFWPMAVLSACAAPVIFCLPKIEEPR